VLGYISVVVEAGVCVGDCRGLGLCEVGIVGSSVGDECEGERSSLVTGWQRMGGKVRAGGREWVRRGRMSCWRGEQWVLAQEKDGEWS
jgi:hypothetical protein